jgi:hypothetical protein
MNSPSPQTPSPSRIVRIVQRLIWTFLPQPISEELSSEAEAIASKFSDPKSLPATVKLLDHFTRSLLYLSFEKVHEYLYSPPPPYPIALANWQRNSNSLIVPILVIAFFAFLINQPWSNFVFSFLFVVFAWLTSSFSFWQYQKRILITFALFTIFLSALATVVTISNPGLAAMAIAEVTRKIPAISDFSQFQQILIYCSGFVQVFYWLGYFGIATAFALPLAPFSVVWILRKTLSRRIAQNF